jgi:hypothetical protein
LNTVGYTSLVRPITKYRAAYWDPNIEGQMNALYQIRKKAAPCTHHTKYSDWESVAQRRTLTQLCALFKAYSAERLGELFATDCHGLTIECGCPKIRDRKQGKDIGMYSFVNSAI